MNWQFIGELIAQRKLQGQLLKRRGSDVLVVRVPCLNGGHVIAKLWNRPNWKGVIRRLTRTSAGFREWQVLQRLKALGLAVPNSIAYVVVKTPNAQYTEVLFSEDLGECQGIGTLIKEFVRRGDEMHLDSIERDLINITETMIHGNVIDRDHRINNFVKRPTGEITRIDFELGSCTNWQARRRGHQAIMLGTLIGSYVFFTQPNVQRAVDFAHQLITRLQPPAGLVWRTDRVIQDMLRRQRRSRNIITSFPPLM